MIIQSARLTAVVMFVAAWTLTAQQPISSPPLFPGALVDSAASEEWGEPGEGQEVKLYSTSAPIEEVFRYYKSQLAAIPSQGNLVDPSKLRAGSATPAFFDLAFHESLPAQHAAALKSKRKPFDNGQWIQSAAITWAVKGSGNQIMSHTVQLEDLSYDEGRYSQKTRIVIQRESGGLTGEATEADRDSQREERRKSGKQQAPVSPSSAQELGAPLYPGAVFNAEATASFTESGTKAYIYLSTDIPAKIASFYSANTGVKPSKDSDGRYLIVLRGTLPYPEWGIEIMPNLLFEKKYKTIITFASWASSDSR